MVWIKHPNYEDDDEDDLVDERGVVRDGGVVHVPLYMINSMQRDLAVRNRTPLLHRPGSVTLSDKTLRSRSVRVTNGRLAKGTCGARRRRLRMI